MDPNLDPARIRSVLDGRWGWMRDEVREVLRRPSMQPPSPGTDVEEQRAWVWDRLRELADTAGPQIGFPKAYGGQDDVGAGVVAFETLAHGDLSLLVKVGVQWGLFGGAVLHLGTERHHEQYLADIATAALPGCFAMTETGHGSDVQSIATTATYDPDTDEFVIHTPHESARKDYIGNAARDGRAAVVFAQLVVAGEEPGVHAFLVPIRDGEGRRMTGVRIEGCGHKGGLNGVDNGRLWFDQVRVPRDALLDRFATVTETGAYETAIESRNRRFFTMLGTLVQGRVSVAGASVAASKSALAIVVRYAEQRRQFHAPGRDHEIRILDYLAHQRRLLPALASTYALHFAQTALVEDLHHAFTDPDFTQRDRRVLESRAAGIKAMATWHARDVIQTCREACGGAGYLSENRLTTMKADTDVFTTFEGDNTVLLQLVAKGLLTNYRDEFEDLDALGTIRFVADQIVDTVVERVSARPIVQSLIDAFRGSDEESEDLRSRGWHLSLFEFREEHILSGLARRIRRGVGEGRDLFEVFNAVQDHLLLAAQAHIDRVVLEHAVDAVSACEDDVVAELLDTVVDLHALWTIAEHRGWYLEHGRLSSGRSKAVLATVNELCGTLRPYARTLVDAFGIPAEALAAPIARPGAVGTS